MEDTCNFNMWLAWFCQNVWYNNKQERRSANLPVDVVDEEIETAHIIILMKTIFP